MASAPASASAASSSLVSASNGKYLSAHSDPHGEGDARPTAEQITRDEGLIGGLTGVTAMVTGCSSGLGVETARALHLTGADVFITARDEAKARQVMDDIRRSNPEAKGRLELILMELDDLDSVRRGAEEFLAKSSKLNILIANAGVMAIPELTKTKQGHEMQFGVCHLAHFLLFQLLRPGLQSASTPERPSRVVMVSSSGHRNGPTLVDNLGFINGGYSPWGAYGQAKTANVWMANEIERRFGSDEQHPIHATSLMPGGILTPLQRHLPEGFIEKAWGSPEVTKFFKNPAQGAATQVWAAIGAPWAHRGGVYLEDCAEAGPKDESSKSVMAPGYAKWAKDEAGARALWAKSNELAGLPAEAQ